MAGESAVLEAIKEVRQAVADLSVFVQRNIAELKTQQATAERNITDIWKNINEFDKTMTSHAITMTEQKGIVTSLQREVQDAMGYARRLEQEIKANVAEDAKLAKTIDDMQSQAKGMKQVFGAVLAIATLITAIQIIRGVIN